MTEVRILIADDHVVVRRGLRAILESHPGWHICGEANSGREAVEQVKHLRPDVAILDITMPDLNGLEAARQIHKEVPQTEVLILTMHDSEEVVREVLRAGARGFLLKSDADAALIAAVEALHQHKPYLTTLVTEFVLDSYVDHDVKKRGQGVPVDHLTPREREIVQLIAEGKSNKEVADQLNISVRTVENHRAKIMARLHLHSSSDLVRYAIRNKIVEA